MSLRHTVIIVMVMAVAAIPSIAGAADVADPGVPPPTGKTPYYYQGIRPNIPPAAFEYNSPYGPPAAYERPVPYPFRPYTPPPAYGNPAPLYCHWDSGVPVWDGRQWSRRLVQVCN